VLRRRRQPQECGRAYLLVFLTQGNAATVLLTPMQATAVAKTGGKVLTNPIRIWSNLDTAASDTLVRQTDAVNYTTDAGVKNKQVVFEIDPASLDLANLFDCVYLSTGASNVANLTAALAILTDLRFGFGDSAVGDRRLTQRMSRDRVKAVSAFVQRETAGAQICSLCS
jgi:hypothetical protein